MPRMPKRRYGRRVGRKRIGAARRLRRARVLPNLGFMKVARKMPPCAIVSSVAGGTASFVGPVGFDLFEVNPITAPATPSVGTIGGYYDVPFAVTVRFNQITQPGDFSALFDTYRIKGVKIQLQNNYNVVGAASTVGGQIGYMPYIEYVYDDDDANALPVLQFREKMGIVTKYFNATNNKLTINLRSPKPRLLTETSIGTSPLVIPKGQTWLNMASTSIPHFGIKGVIRRMYLPAGAHTSSINIDATMYFDVKDVQ